MHNSEQRLSENHNTGVIHSVLWTILMGLVTVLLCLLIAERYLGITGHVTDVKYDASGTAVEWTVDVRQEPGRWFRDICLIVIPILFAGKVRWRYTWINLFVYIVSYFPIREFVGVWPAMGYLETNSGFLRIPQYVNAFVMAFHFWIIQSLVFWAYNAVRYLWRTWKNRK